MLRVFVAALCGLTLSGCASLLENAYDEQAREECDRERSSERGACYDEVEQNRRDRER